MPPWDSAPVPVDPNRRRALDSVRRRRGELAEDAPPGTDPDAVPVMLAREIAYDIALLELAAVRGIETNLERFEQPWQERARLERALRDSGVTLPSTENSPLPAPRRS